MMLGRFADAALTGTTCINAATTNATTVTPSATRLTKRAAILAGWNIANIILIRHILEIPDLTSHQRVILSVKSDDGFVAYVNAREVGRIRIPEAADKKTLPHNATANNAFEPLKPDELDVTKYLKSGKNILALHGVNRALQSSDFSLIPVIRAESRPVINKGKKVRAERNF